MNKDKMKQASVSVVNTLMEQDIPPIDIPGIITTVLHATLASTCEYVGIEARPVITVVDTKSDTIMIAAEDYSADELETVIQVLTKQKHVKLLEEASATSSVLM